MREKRRKFTPEFKSEAVRLVVDTSRPIAEVAREIGVHEGTLGNWVNQYRAEHTDDEPPLTLPERARLRELERENRELRMKTEFLGKAAAFFAQEIHTISAEKDRRRFPLRMIRMNISRSSPPPDSVPAPRASLKPPISLKTERDSAKFAPAPKMPAE